MVDKQVDLVDDIITFFQKLGASNELSNRNFDTGDFFSEECSNFVLDLGKKYGLYDEVEEVKDVNYVIGLKDKLVVFFQEKLIAAFNMDYNY